MSVVMQRESTEFVYIGVSGTAPNSAELAFLQAGTRPEEADWEAATLIENDLDPQWEDAVDSGATGDYYVTLLIGSFGGTGVELVQGDYQVWLRLTGTTERPVRIAPTTLEIA